MNAFFAESIAIEKGVEFSSSRLGLIVMMLIMFVSHTHFNLNIKSDLFLPDSRFFFSSHGRWRCDCRFLTGQKTLRFQSQGEATNTYIRWAICYILPDEGRKQSDTSLFGGE